MPECDMLNHDSEQIRVLTVNSGEHLDGILYKLKKGFSRNLIVPGIVLYILFKLYFKIFCCCNRFQKMFYILGWKVEFRLGASLLGQTLDVFINYPLSAEKRFERHSYYQLPWVDESTTVHLTLPGSYHYYVTDQYV